MSGGSQAVTSLPAQGNWYDDDHALKRLLAKFLSPEAMKWAEPVLAKSGEDAATRLHLLAATADKNPPVLHPRDQLGNRVDRIEFHPAYDELRQASYGNGIIGHYYDPAVRKILGPYRETVKLMHGYIFGQAEQGLFCPICLTDGTAFMIEQFGSEEQKKKYLPHLTATNLKDLWEGAMFLTEKAGGSDVGAGETVAKPLKNGLYALSGEKWFCSNAGAELAMVLARPEGAPEGTRGLGLFLLKRHDKDGQLNNLHLERLKPKLGTRSMPTGEIIFDSSVAEPVGALDKGFVQMAEMLNLSRLYNATASVALSRSVLREVLRWCRTRRAFGRTLVSMPLVRATLAELICETEAGLHLLFDASLRRGRVVTAGATDEDQHILRVVTPLLKYSTARSAVRAASEAIELLGGNGYIEDWPLARLFRDAQVLPVWEGTTNILVLDAIRALKKDGCAENFFSFLKTNCQDNQLGKSIAELKESLPALLASSGQPEEAWSRPWCDLAVRVMQATLLTSSASDQRSRAVAEQYLRRHFSSDASTVKPTHLANAATELETIL